MSGVLVIGDNLCVAGHVVVNCRRANSIILGKNVNLVSRFRSNLVGLTNKMVMDTVFGGRIVIGNNSGLSGVILSSKNQIVIGENVKIGGNVRLFDHDFHSTNFRARRNGVLNAAELQDRPIYIGNDVFIGTNAIILKGTKIGDRSIVGAGAVVAGLDVPPDSLIFGNPARVIRQLQ
jgi:acetyltransferase-like isoleucine patch superfamily enzyme